jgi:hypothetical protein
MDTFKIICAFDSAIDFAAANTLNAEKQVTPLHEYVNTRDYKSIEPCIKPGELPTEFICRRLSRSFMNGQMARVTNESEQAVLAFSYGVVGILGMKKEGASEPIEWAPTGRNGEAEYCTRDDLEAVSPAEVQEIGGVIYQKSFLPQSMQRQLRLWRTSVELVARMLP